MPFDGQFRSRQKKAGGKKMSFADAVRTCLSKYVDFQGRAMRSEYWWFVLFTIIVEIVTTVIDKGVLGYPVLYTIAALGLILPSLAVAVRRLHDTDRSGWWLLISLIPLIGAILLIVWFCTKGSVSQNRFG
jgi:uncharacterized membrane protein YhaH (DUF805 family)